MIFNCKRLMIMEQELPLLVVATRNAHKTGEIRAMLPGNGK